MTLQPFVHTINAQLAHARRATLIWTRIVWVLLPCSMQSNCWKHCWCDVWAIEKFFLRHFSKVPFISQRSWEKSYVLLAIKMACVTKLNDRSSMPESSIWIVEMLFSAQYDRIWQRPECTVQFERVILFFSKTACGGKLFLILKISMSQFWFSIPRLEFEWSSWEIIVIGRKFTVH